MPKRQPAKPERLVAYVDPAMKRLAEREAESRHVSVSTLVWWALDAYLKPKGRRP